MLRRKPAPTYTGKPQLQALADAVVRILGERWWIEVNTFSRSSRSSEPKAWVRRPRRRRSGRQPVVRQRHRRGHRRDPRGAHRRRLDRDHLVRRAGLTMGRRPAGPLDRPDRRRAVRPGQHDRDRDRPRDRPRLRGRDVKRLLTTGGRWNALKDLQSLGACLRRDDRGFGRRRGAGPGTEHDLRVTARVPADHVHPTRTRLQPHVDHRYGDRLGRFNRASCPGHACESAIRSTR